MARPTAGSDTGRERLLHAAWDCLADVRGESGRVTVAQVCGVAGCTPPTLYHHFNDLPSLLSAASERAFRNWAERIESAIGPDDEPSRRLRARALAYLEWGASNPRAYKALFSSGTDARGPGVGFTRLVVDLARHWRVSEDDPRLQVRALAHWGAVHGLTLLSIDVPAIPAHVVTDALDVLARALLGEPLQQE